MNRSVSKWDLTVKPKSISVMPSSNVLIACKDLHDESEKLVELSNENGDFVRDFTGAESRHRFG